MVALRPIWLVLLLTLAAFGAGISGAFVFDDHAIFTDPAITSLSGWADIWGLSQTRPLTYLTFWLNYRISGRSPAAFHAVNLILHVGTVTLLWFSLRLLLPVRIAVIAAGLFALHPIQSEAVLYVFARSTLLAAFFCVLSLWLWVRGRQWWAVAAFAFALLSKEECIAWPLFLLGLDLTKRRKDRLPAIGAMLALAVLAAVRLLYAAAVPGSGAGASAGITPFEYLSTQGFVILRYFQLLIVPWGFTADPDIRLDEGSWLAWAIVFVIAAAAVRLSRRTDVALWFLGGLLLLLPSSSVFPLADLSADRRMYLPMAAFAPSLALLIASLLSRVFSANRSLTVAAQNQRFRAARVSKRYRRRHIRMRRYAPTAIFVICSLLSFQRTQVWGTEEYLWREAVRLAPNKVRPKIQLARTLEPRRAIPLLEDAKRIAPADALVASELGRMYLMTGDTAKALAEFGRALALAPDSPAAYSNRGVALLMMKQEDAAIQDFRRALQIDPCLFEARLNLLRLGVATPESPDCRYTPEEREALASP